MGAFKGTKVPWEVVDAAPVDNKNIQIKTENLISVIDADLETVAICGRKEPMQIANAKLIAAAPELLEALIEVVRISDRNNIAWNRAKEAIKKATE